MSNTYMKNQYPSLWIFCSIFRTLGVIIIIASIIGVILGLIFAFKGSITFTLYFIIGSIGIILIFALPFLAFAELIKVFIKIELNTRKDNPVAYSSYGEWLKDNPSKSLDDYLAMRDK